MKNLYDTISKELPDISGIVYNNNKIICGKIRIQPYHQQFEFYYGDHFFGVFSEKEIKELLKLYGIGNKQ